MDVFWKYLERFVRNKSMHDELLGFLKLFGSLLRLLRLLTLEKAFRQLPFNSELRSWSTFKKRKLDFFFLSEFCYWTKVKAKYVF